MLCTISSTLVSLIFLFKGMKLYTFPPDIFCGIPQIIIFKLVIKRIPKFYENITWIIRTRGEKKVKTNILPKLGEI